MGSCGLQTLGIRASIFCPLVLADRLGQDDPNDFRGQRPSRQAAAFSGKLETFGMRNSFWRFPCYETTSADVNQPALSAGMTMSRSFRYQAHNSVQSNI